MGHPGYQWDKSPFPKKVKFTSAPIKYSPSKQLCSVNVNENDDLCLEEIEHDLSREISNMSI